MLLNIARHVILYAILPGTEVVEHTEDTAVNRISDEHQGDQNQDRAVVQRHQIKPARDHNAGGDKQDTHRTEQDLVKQVHRLADSEEHQVSNKGIEIEG